MTIKGTGNVGIGTTAPASKLDVAGTVTATSFSGSGSGLTGVTASAISPANLTAAISMDSIANGAVTSAKLTGSVNVTDSLVVGDSRLAVLRSSYVGVGTASPNTFLEVLSAATKDGSNHNAYNVIVRDNQSAATGVGGAIAFQGYKTTTSAIGMFAAVSGIKENATGGDENGALVLQTRLSGTPVRRICDW